MAQVTHLANNEPVMLISRDDIQPGMGDGVCGYIQSGMVYFLDYKSQQLFEKNKEKYGRGLFWWEPLDDNIRESDFQAEFVKSLYGVGDIKEYKKCRYGIVDVYIDCIDQIRLYELKVAPSNHEIIEAIGQLLSYSFAFEKPCQLFFVSDSSINPKYIALFDHFEIQVICFPMTAKI